MLKEYLSNIANAIRSKLGTTDKVNAQNFADKVNEVYDKGKETMSKEMWDMVTNNNNRTEYSSFFLTAGNLEKINIPYVIKPTSVSKMFYNMKGATLPPKSCIDMSNVVSNNENYIIQLYCWAEKILVIPDYGLPALDKCAQLFNYCRRVRTIELVRVHENTTFSSTFNQCTNLTHVRFEGTIGRNISFSNSPLDTDTLKHIIGHLKNYAGTDKEGVYTVTFIGTCWEVLESSGKPFDDGFTTDETMTWQDYVQSLGWLI